MKTLIWFLKNFLMFLILPFTWYQIEMCGQVGFGWNTLVRDRYNRSYRSSILEPLLLWIGFFCTNLMLMIFVKGQQAMIPVAVANFVIWFMVLIPVISRSYESVNWRKAAFFSAELRSRKLSSDEINKLVKNFLVLNLSSAMRDGSNKEFDHLEHVLRVSDFWKGARMELVDVLYPKHSTEE